jgi:uncharacterized protein
MAFLSVTVLLLKSCFIASSLSSRLTRMLKLARQQPLALYFVLAYAISWAVWFTGAALGRSGSLEEFWVFLFVGSFGPALAGVTLSGLRGGMPEVQALLWRIVQARVRWPVYVATWFVLPSVICFGLFVLGFVFKTGAILNVASLIIAMPINGFLTAFLSPGPLGEEPGWRGFALPQMTCSSWQTIWRTDALLGLLWAFWHLPVAILIPAWRDVFPGMGIDLPMWLILYPISVIALTVMLSRLWNWSGGSIFICILFHGVINTTFQIVDKVSTPYSALVTFLMLNLLLWIAALIFVALDRLVFERNGIDPQKEPIASSKQ